MKTIIIIFSFMASSVYAHSKFCPEAGLSDEQKDECKAGISTKKLQPQAFLESLLQAIS